MKPLKRTIDWTIFTTSTGISPNGSNLTILLSINCFTFILFIQSSSCKYKGQAFKYSHKTGTHVWCFIEWKIKNKNKNRSNTKKNTRKWRIASCVAVYGSQRNSVYFVRMCSRINRIFPIVHVISVRLFSILYPYLCRCVWLNSFIYLHCDDQTPWSWNNNKTLHVDEFFFSCFLKRNNNEERQQKTTVQLQQKQRKNLNQRKYKTKWTTQTKHRYRYIHTIHV